MKRNLIMIKDCAGVNLNNAGVKLQHYVYSAFGVMLGIEDASANDITSNPVIRTAYTYTGREYDSESGYYYYRARYYDAFAGRFLQKDPHPGFFDSPFSIVNGYGYTQNDPTNATDPTGMLTTIQKVAIGVGITAFTLTGLGLLVGGASLCTALGGASIAVLSTAGGALAMAAIQSATSGHWGSDFWKNAEINFIIGGIGLIYGSTGSFFGKNPGLAEAGGNGFQGYIQTKAAVFPGSYAAGTSAVLNGSHADATHEFGHTVFALGFAAVSGFMTKPSPSAGPWVTWSLYGLHALPGIMSRDGSSDAYATGGFEEKTIGGAGRISYPGAIRVY